MNNFHSQVENYEVASYLKLLHYVVCVVLDVYTSK
ncbi:hypothetical protein EV693_11828 [Nicoletella semolina]|uniref:Uncharacterized protein n=1 Tax=Nicoletella semolina TaxID=271160 RepID=A0A4R2N4B9_9PAST|nr:hypothetical protein EV693_11828 [Nicoletella semolina]